MQGRRDLQQMRRWGNRKYLTAAGVAAAIAVAAAVMSGASGVSGLFEPKNFSRFQNHNSKDEFDYVAGDGQDADLADQNKNGDGSGDQDQLRTLAQEQLMQNTAAQGSLESENSATLGRADDSNVTSEDQNNNGIQFVNSNKNNNANTIVNPGTAGNHTDNSGNGNHHSGGSTPGDNTNNNNGNKPGSDHNGNDDNNGGGGSDNNGQTETPSTGESETPSTGGSETPATGETPSTGETETPATDETETPPTKDNTETEETSSWEDNQLKPKDQVVTEYGILTGLSATFNKDYYTVNETYSAEDAVVTGTFRQADGSTVTRELSYGGSSGYDISYSTAERGSHIAIFSYKGMTVRTRFEVLYSYATLNYYAAYEGGYYSSVFPGTVLKQQLSAEDYETLRQISTETYAKNSNFIDLSEMHSIMIAQLGNAALREMYAKESENSSNHVVFLDEGEDGYLLNMLTGYAEMASQALVDKRTYVYYPVSDWGQAPKNLLNLVTAVPEGCKIRRTVTDGEDLVKGRGRQVLEKYTGSEETMEVPMGVTDIDLKDRAESVKTVRIPQSVQNISSTSLGENLPNLENYEYEDAELQPDQNFKIMDGVLYSADGKTLLSVPAGRTEFTVPKTVTALAEGCFAGMSADAQITFESEEPPEIKGATGFQGKIIVPQSEYDLVCKRYMFRFAEECENITFAAKDGKEDRYVYIAEPKMLCMKKDPTILAAIPEDAAGDYQVDDSITEVAEGAFAGCDALTDITFGEALTKFQDNSLILSNSVEHLILGSENVKVDANVFGRPGSTTAVPEITVYVESRWYDDYLESWGSILDPIYGEGTAQNILTSEERVYIYEDGAKYQKTENDGNVEYRLVTVYQKDKTALKIKEGTTRISKLAFEGCDRLEILEIPESVVKLSDGLFDSCTALETVAVDAASVLENGNGGVRKEAQIYTAGIEYQKFIYDEGILYGRNSTGTHVLLNVPTDRTKWVKVLERTVAFADEAFKDCKRYEGFSMDNAPESLQQIGDNCFENNTTLLFADFGDCTNLKKIGKEVFKNCSEMTSVVLPDRVREIPDESFYGCSKLYRIQANGVRTIGDFAFENCTNLREIKDMPELTTIGDAAFRNCTNLVDYTFTENMREIGESCFENCISLQTVTMDGSLEGISRYCFYGCNRLKTVTIGETQKEKMKLIGVQAFAECEVLTSLDLSDMPKLKRIGAGAFEDCRELATLKLPENLEKVPDGAVKGCESLSILQLGGSTPPQLGEKIFGEELLPFIHIWVQEPYLQDYIDACQEQLDGEYGEGTANKIFGVINDHQEIIKGVTYENTDAGRILVSASENLSGAYTVLPDTIRIEDGAFRNCQKLESITLPQGSSMELGDGCFKGCSALKTAQISSNITKWGAETFMDCTGLQMAVIGKDGNTEIPEIGARAFKNCSSLAARGSVTIYAAVHVYGEGCFENCTNLPAIALTAAAQTNLEEIQDAVFKNCTSLTAFLTSKFSGLKTVGKEAFYNCDSLKTPSIPANVKSIGEACFMNCDSVTAVSFYGALEEYPKDCFKNCVKLGKTGGTAAAFAGLKRIGEGAYEGCVSLTSGSNNWGLEKYTNLESIGSRAFYGCVSLPANALSATVQSVGESAFDGCSSLTSLTLKGETLSDFGKFTLDTLAEGFRILVPDSADREDIVYRNYFEQFEKLYGQEKTYEILDSVTDGAKERNPLDEGRSGEDKEPAPAKETESEKESETSTGSETAKETESQKETESTKETEKETESQKETESSKETETEKETESSKETETEKETEKQTESHKETEGSKETETQTETEKAAGSGTAAESRKVTEQKQQQSETAAQIQGTKEKKA